MIDCILWNGCKNTQGYGLTKKNGKTVRAHRVAYEEAFGEIPEGLHVLHRCDNPSCVNPEHLFLGTNRDNINDKVKKNRAQRLKGETNGNSRVSKDDVATIRELYDSGEYSLKQLGTMFGVHFGTIHCITTRKTWSHI